MHTSVKCNYFVRGYVIHHVGIMVNRNWDTAVITVANSTSVLNDS